MLQRRWSHRQDVVGSHKSMRLQQSRTSDQADHTDHAEVDGVDESPEELRRIVISSHQHVAGSDHPLELGKADMRYSPGVEFRLRYAAAFQSIEMREHAADAAVTQNFCRVSQQPNIVAVVWDEVDSPRRCPAASVDTPALEQISWMHKPVRREEPLHKAFADRRSRLGSRPTQRYASPLFREIQNGRPPGSLQCSRRQERRLTTSPAVTCLAPRDALRGGFK
ncbi:hypothetical protein [Mesorhizobium sp.]|uniref:hypothetical protein n=1 Tax=Mesorhizobium sp. TaxID=1871066 RepID=UPI000FE79E57|nr:hypothetical protein [Mesorhizobium sp.]RWM44257.1 MAG: hypothetical protein EOR76_25955 [Mesorhizobium sp.]RWM49531.1 MAG: hypothetical protein EOR78_27120 [Mesorhizobium sp.]RWM61552.1 MAG: hypothetical protein EOR79_04170 [Mesorhizobium sp.]TIO71350.1 MAG: hypothetical protein E5X85_02865 [Mesorhizobium sp.]